MSKKFDWKDKELLTQLVNQHSTFKDVLVAMGLKNIRSNVITFKKYTSLYEIDINHITNKTPSVIDPTDDRLKIKFNLLCEKEPSDDNMKITLDWTIPFITTCKQMGLEGSDEDIIEQYLVIMYKGLLSNIKKEKNIE